MEEESLINRQQLSDAQPLRPSTTVPTQYIERATADSTRKAYRQDVKHFELWGGKLPTDTTTIIHYLHQHANKLNARTLKRRITALRQFHLALGFPDPTIDPAIRKTLRGIQNTHGKPKQRAPALRLPQLEQLIDSLQSEDSLASYRDRCLLSLGFFGALRGSELLKLSVDDLGWQEQGINLRIQRSKTDQGAEGQWCALPELSNALCPVMHTKAWLKHSSISQGYLFRQINRWQQLGPQPLSMTGLNKRIKQLAQVCGWPEPQNYSSHSLRRGLATSASAAGANFKSIMRQGRWKHEGTVLQYIEEGQAFEDNPVNALFNHTPQITPYISYEPEQSLDLSKPSQSHESEGA